jgi:hypothetical protein
MISFVLGTEYADGATFDIVLDAALVSVGSEAFGIVSSEYVSVGTDGVKVAAIVEVMVSTRLFSSVDVNVSSMA